jgi:hypothetical protein
MVSKKVKFSLSCYLNKAKMRKDRIIIEDGEVDDTVSLMGKVVWKYLDDTSRLAPLLQKGSLEATCRALWEFIYHQPIELKSFKHRFCSDTCRFKYHDDRRDRRFLSRKEYRAPMAAQNGRKAKFDLFGD